ncbi:TPA: hypothetical protein ACOAY7_002972 [Vibrio cholerae]|nr:hypothetical protein 2017DRC106_0330 [Vibrio phage ICP1]QVV97694.1 hypothetical protein 2017DRC32_0330 [Vibrio phage ICP1]QVV97921.1 hypothetical protein 2017DRC48_0330 [Vibrio phage ICP1]QVV98148.1 hypothetical protein 2017DRC55_0330 [Vibrio phage ICP1]QVV98374.1 hypothetical protein 2017DRC72_0325 [Vibrio phage ICP1]
MKCDWSNISLGFRFGTIDDMTKEAIEVAKLLDTKVNFEFNGVLVNVSKHSDVEDVCFKTMDALKIGKKSVYGKGV